MNASLEYAACALVIGTGATVVMDIAGIAIRSIWGIPTPSYALVGRWVAYVMQGRFGGEPITASTPIRGERYIGWATHYAVGVAFAGVLLLLWGVQWVRDPTPAPALIVGVGTLIFPFLVMQPGMGAGIAASRTPNPRVSRLRSLLNHGLFGLGLYVTGWMTHRVWSF